MMRKYGMEMDHSSGAAEHQIETMEQADSLQPMNHGQHRMPQVDSLELKDHKQQLNQEDSLPQMDHMDHRQQMEKDSLQQLHQMHQMHQRKPEETRGFYSANGPYAEEKRRFPSAAA